METQKTMIVKRLLEMGGISRNWALRNFISRLSAHILQLRREGWEFETIRHNGNYIYKTIKCPLQKVEYRAGDKVITRYESKND